MIRFAVREILPVILFLLPLYLLLHTLYYRDTRKTAVYFIFCFYLCAVYALVGLPNVTYVRFELQGNLVPLRGMLAGLKSSLQNVLLFVPLGIFLPLLVQRYRDMRRTVCFGLFLSLAIELLQIFTYRATDVNDLITNTLGAFLGFVLAGLLRRGIPALETGLVREKGKDLPVVFASAFGIMFFLQPFAVMLL